MHITEVMLKFEQSSSTAQNASKTISELLQKSKMPFRKYFGKDAMFIRIFTWLGLQGVLKNQFIKK